MPAVQTQRTVVKSVPELWAELSEVALLGPMLDGFGEIRITRVVPEASIEWESGIASGCVELEPGGFGTRVRLTAELSSTAAPPIPAPVSAEPARRSLLSRLLRRSPATHAPAPPAAAGAQPVPTIDCGRAEGVLTAVLDQIGAARHRPFSRDAAARPPAT